MVAIVAPIFHGISFRHCGPLHGGGICHIDGSPWVHGDTSRRVGPCGGGSFDVCPGAGSARGGHAHLIVARLYSVAAPGAGGHSAECILPVVMSTAAAATKFLARHGMIDVAALHVSTTVTGRGYDAGVGSPLFCRLSGVSLGAVLCMWCCRLWNCRVMEVLHACESGACGVALVPLQCALYFLATPSVCCPACSLLMPLLFSGAIALLFLCWLLHEGHER